MKTYINIIATIFAIALTVAFIFGPLTMTYDAYMREGVQEQFAACLLLSMIYFTAANIVWIGVIKAWRENISFGQALYNLI